MRKESTPGSYPYTKHFSSGSFTSSLVLFLVIFSSAAMAQGNLLITPRRVVFDGQKKSQELNLANTGKDTAKYVISFVQIRMKEDGSFETITEPDPGQNFADKFLRFFPRMVTLGPNEAQVIKIQLTKTGDLQPGEYRSHIYFRAVPDEKPLGEEAPKDTTTIAVKLTPIFGITIPVIIRVGPSDTKVSLSDISLDTQNDSQPKIRFAINRTGNMSVYGDISVEYIAQDGKITPAGSIKGIAVYTPNMIRRVWIDVNKTAAINYHTGKFRITLTTPTDEKSVKLAESVLSLQ
jgi:P pilus assembly chaperone PapD